MSNEAFRGSAGPTLGVELEFQLVDSETMALTGAADKVIAEIPDSDRDAIGPEFYHCCVEVNTGICRTVNDVERDLSDTVAATSRAASRLGVHLAWGGTHPFSHWKDQPVVPDPRYLELADHYGETLCRQLTFGMHVHVGVPDGDSATRVCNQIGEHLPCLLALSANSPFWCGRATGLQSHRVEVMGASPTGGFPPHLDDWNAYAHLVDQLTDVGVIQTSKDLWWDVRPSPSHGTVEVRMCDVPADLNAVLGLAALTQCLVADLARNEDHAPRLDEGGKIVLRQNRWRAARFGLHAEFVNPHTGEKSPARESVRNLVARFRGLAEELDCARHLERVAAMTSSPGGAERQLAVFDRTGDLTAVTRSMTGVLDPQATAAGLAAAYESGAFSWPVSSAFHASRVPSAVH